MKKFLILAFILCSFFTAKAENIVTASPTSIGKGVDIESKNCGTLNFRIKTTELLAVLNFDLYIPNCLVVKTAYSYLSDEDDSVLPFESGKRGSTFNHELSFNIYPEEKQDKDGYTRYLINIYAEDGSMFESTEGSLMSIDLGSVLDAADGIYNIYVNNQSLNVSAVDGEIGAEPVAASYVIYGNPSDRTFHAEGPLASIFTSEILEGTTIDLSNAESIAGSCSNNVNVTYSRNVSNAWNTICLPYDVTSTSAVQYYNITKVCEDKLEVSPVTTLVAGTPALAKVNGGVLSAPAENVTINSTLKNSSSMFGTFAPIKVEDPEAYYISQNKFWLNNEYFNVSAFKAYFKNVSHLAKSNSLVIDESHPTAINNAEINLNAAEEVYGINGARQSSVQKGMNVVKIGNKVMKVVVK